MLIIIAVKDKRIRGELEGEKKNSPHTCLFAIPDYKGLLSAFFDASLQGAKNALFMADADFDSEIPNLAEEIAAQFGILIIKADCRERSEFLHQNEE